MVKELLIMSVLDSALDAGAGTLSQLASIVVQKAREKYPNSGVELVNTFVEDFLGSLTTKSSMYVTTKYMMYASTLLTGIEKGTYGKQVIKNSFSNFSNFANFASNLPSPGNVDLDIVKGNLATAGEIKTLKNSLMLIGSLSNVHSKASAVSEMARGVLGTSAQLDTASSENQKTNNFSTLLQAIIEFDNAKKV